MGYIQFLHDMLHVKNRMERIAAEQTAITEQTIKSQTNEIIRQTRIQYLSDKAINSETGGVTPEKHCDYEVVVSLTSYGKRIHEAYLAIESIMQGTVKPNRIVLWLAEEMKGNILPVVLQNQVRRGLEIAYCKDIRSYKKLIPSLKKYFEACIITIDDDLLYEPDLVEHLLAAYSEHPDCVSACRTHRIKFDENGEMLPYKQWGQHEYTDEPSNMNFITSGGGVIFPPHCFPEVVFDEDTFMTICPTADDIWFNAMLFMNGVKVNKAFTHNASGEDFIRNESPYEQPLCIENVNNDRNDAQIKNVFHKYGIKLEKDVCK